MCLFHLRIPPVSSMCAYVLNRFSCVQLFVTIWTVARQAPLSMGFSRQEYWSVLPCLPPGDLPDSGIEPTSFTSPALEGRFLTTSTTWEAVSSTAHWIKASDQNTQRAVWVPFKPYWVTMNSRQPLGHFLVNFLEIVPALMRGSLVWFSASDL